MLRLIPYILFPRPGWFILHAAAIGLLFWLGYSIDFAPPP